MKALVVRYSALGDVILAASVTGALGPVGFVTLPRYHALVRRFPGVVGVFGPGDTLPDLPIYDLHHSLRSRRLPATRRVERQDLRRRLRVWIKAPPADPVLTRYGRACGVTPAPLPWLPPVRRGDALIVAPGAAHATKRWPWFAALAARWDGPVRAIGGPGDEAALAPFGVVPDTGFAATLEALEGAAVLVGGDTGLLHLGAAVGVPVVGLFGPTTSADGFWSPGYGTAVELPLSCRPCSRFGGAVCPIGDHACLRTLTVDAVLAAARRAAHGEGGA